ncbi:hypothetical protein EBT16_12760, partial [bacterium]|nr:hypothetical protein [bacterium]
GSGLGGVSSNAGTVLKYLTETKQLTLHESEMFAKQLGADVPFFLNPVPSWVTGIGEIRTPICFRPEIKSQLCFLLVLFPFPTSTPSLFQKYRDLSLPFSPPLKLDLTETWNFGSMVQFLKSTQNDLESLVASHSDPIHKALKSLRSSSPLYAGLSGTGSTCFAVFSSEKERADAAKELQAFCRDLNCRCVFAETY